MARSRARVATAACIGWLLLASAGCVTSGGTPSSAIVPIRTPSTTSATLPGTLYFTHTVSGDVQTALVADQAGTRQLTEPGVMCCVLRKSPVSDHLLVLPALDFSAPLTGGTIGPAGGAPTALERTDPTLNMVPSAWSPDGQRIAFEAWDDNDDSRTGVYTARASDGGGLVRVTKRPGRFHDVPLDYSPDGKRLIFYRSSHPDPDPYTDGSLWVVNIDGTGARKISTRHAPPTVWARWSPDGTRILFAAERLASKGPLWTMAADGTDLRTIYQDPRGGFVIAPDWSPDGSQIVFALDPTNDEFEHPDNSVYVIHADGSNLRLVNGSPDFKRQLEWVD